MRFRKSDYASVVDRDNNFLYLGLTVRGGHIFVYSQELIISECFMSKSFANAGGAIYYHSLAEGRLRIINSYIDRSYTSLNENAIGRGGAVFVFAQDSELDLIILDTTFSYTTARYQGGVLYIEPSREYMFVLLKDNLFYYNSAMNGALMFGNFPAEGIVNIDDNQFVHSKKEVNKFLYSILDYERDDMITAQELIDPSYIYLSGVKLTLNRNIFRDIYYLQVL